MRLKPADKITAIKEVLIGKQSVYSVCKKYQISKAIFYKWLNTYKKSRKNQALALESKVRCGKDHYRSLTQAQKFAVLSFIHKNPTYSCRKVSQALGIGHHAIQNLLKRQDLNRVEARIEFSRKPFWKRETADRREGMLTLYQQGWKIKDICRHYNISRPTFNKWKERYFKAREGERASALNDRQVNGVAHHNSSDEGKQAQVLDVVKANPELSVHQIHAQIPRIEGRPIVGHHGIQNVLERNNLNTIDQRTVWAQPQPVIEPMPVPTEAPAPPRSALIRILSPFATIPTLVVTTPATWPFALPFILLIAYIFEVDKAFRPTV